MKANMKPMVMQRAEKNKRFARSRVIMLFAVALVMLAALWAASQCFARQVGYHPSLNSQIMYEHIYRPWAILIWAKLWYSAYPAAFQLPASIFTAVSGVGLLLLVLKGLLSANAEKASDYLHGSARWAEKKDIRAAGLLSTDGVFAGGWKDKNGRLHYLRHNGSEHLLCFAPTRSGKGICLVIPTLLTWMESCVITDLKGELWALTAGWRQKYANNYVLRFEPASSDGSAHWNPMEEIRIGTDYEIGDAQNLATCIVDPDGKGLRDHWQKTSQALIVGCILHLLYKKEKGDITDASLPALDAMLSDPARPVKDLWQEMKSYSHRRGKNHPVVGQAAQDMIDRPDQEAGSVLSTAKSYLSLYRDDVVASNVRDSSFKIRDLMNAAKPVSLYIVTQPADKVRLKPLVRVLINMICRVLAARMDFVETPVEEYSFFQKFWRLLCGQPLAPAGGRRARANYKHKLLMMMDEFPSLGKLEIVQESLAFLAGYGIRFYIICQDINQLKSEETGYGRDEAISSNCHIQNAFQPNRQDTAKYLSAMTGQTTVIKEQITVSGKRLGIIQGQVSKSMQEVSRPLMTEDEVIRMPPARKNGEQLIEGGDMLVFAAGFPAIYGKQMPYFQDPVFIRRSQVNPPEKSDSLHENQPVQVRIALSGQKHSTPEESSPEPPPEAGEEPGIGREEAECVNLPSIPF